MAWIFEIDGNATGYAAIAPPTNEQGKVEAGWTEVTEGDPRINAATNPPPPIKSSAKWEEFRSRMMTSPVMLNVAVATANAFYYPPLVSAMWQLGGNPAVMTDISTLWNIMITNYPLKPKDVSDLNTIVTECKIPFKLDSTGAIVPL